MGITMPASLEQFWNADCPMLMTPLPSEAFVKPVQPENAEFPMLVTLPGIVMLVRVVLELNAEFPMLVTGSPLVVLGMVTSPPGPVYPVMVIAPLLVTNSNWACTTAGSGKSNSSGSSLVAQAVLKHLAIVLGHVVLTVELAAFMY